MTAYSRSCGAVTSSGRRTSNLHASSMCGWSPSVSRWGRHSVEVSSISAAALKPFSHATFAAVRLLASRTAATARTWSGLGQAPRARR